MTVNLYDVNDALKSEDKAIDRLRRALDWKLRKKERGEEKIQEASKSPEVGLPEEAR